MSKISELDIFTNYLIPPSPLPSLLPYTNFLQLVPQTLRQDPANTQALKRIYRDFQFQRNITVDQVRENIERECGPRSTGLRLRLSRRIAFEEGMIEEDELQVDPKHPDDEARRKRRKIVVDESEDENEAEDGDQQDVSGVIADESDEEYEREQLLQKSMLVAEQAMVEDPGCLHPAAHVLPPPPAWETPDGQSQKRMQERYDQRFHTKTSLLEAMRQAEKCMKEENDDLEAEVMRVLSNIKDTVGGLSDLRYGRLNDGVEEEALEALRQLR